MRLRPFHGRDAFAPHISFSLPKGIFRSLRERDTFLQPPLLFLSAEKWAFCPLRGQVRLHPTFLFLCQKKKRHLRAKSLAALGCAPKRACGRRRPVQRKRGLAAALRCLGLLRIDRFLVIVCAAIWKFFRMRSTNSAAAAQWGQQISYSPLKNKHTIFSAVVASKYVFTSTLLPLTGATNVVLPTERQRKEKIYTCERRAKAETESD